jgi:hypothetical protein
MVRRLLCAVHGHRDALRLLDPTTLSVECQWCGRVSTGVSLRPAYRRTQAPKGSATRIRRRLARTWLCHRLEGVA